LRVFTFCPIYISGAGKKGHPDRGDSRSLFRGRPVRKTIVFGYCAALVPLRDYPSGSVPSKEPCRVLPHRGGQGQAGWEKEGGKGGGVGTDGG